MKENSGFKGQDESQRITIETTAEVEIYIIGSRDFQENGLQGWNSQQKYQKQPQKKNKMVLNICQDQREQSQVRVNLFFFSSYPF